jgi:hypothetical protein
VPILLDDQPVFATTSERAVYELLATQLGPDDLLGAGVRVTLGGEDREIDLLVGLATCSASRGSSGGWWSSS